MCVCVSFFIAEYAFSVDKNVPIYSYLKIRSSLSRWYRWYRFLFIFFNQSTSDWKKNIVICLDLSWTPWVCDLSITFNTKYLSVFQLHLCVYVIFFKYLRPPAGFTHSHNVIIPFKLHPFLTPPIHKANTSDFFDFLSYIVVSGLIFALYVHAHTRRWQHRVHRLVKIAKNVRFVAFRSTRVPLLIFNISIVVKIYSSYFNIRLKKKKK